jgi:hypothetical protein
MLIMERYVKCEEMMSLLIYDNTYANYAKLNEA